MKKLYSFSYGFIRIFSLALASLLFLGGMLFTCFSTDMASQLVLTRQDPLLWNILWLLVSVGAILFISRLFCPKKTYKISPATILTALVILWYLAGGSFLVFFGRTVPAADAMSVYQIAKALVEGNSGVIHPTDSYLAYYPQQIGLATYFQLLIRFWNLLPFQVEAFHFIELVNVVLACVSILFQKYTIRLLFQNPRAEILYLLLAGANLPFVMYTSFVYGEIPSFAAVSAGSYFFLKLLLGKSAGFRQNLQNGAAAVLLLTLSVILRKNSLIILIAAVIVGFLYGFFKRQKQVIFCTLFCALLGFSALPALQKGYELWAGNPLGGGVTPLSYVAMGMQESSRGNGWYNGFNFNTYLNTELDPEAADQISWQAVATRLEYFSEHPNYALDFYFHKHLSQWADGTYACRQATLATFGGRTALVDSLYEGSLSRGLIGYCNLYQNLLYLGLLFFTISVCRHPQESSLPVFLGLIGITGGFLFHIFWEANSRYIFIYSLLIMPYCAQGLALLDSRNKERKPVSR